MASIKSFPNNQDEYVGAEYVMKWLHGRTSGVFGANGNAAVAALGSPGMAVTISDGVGWMANGNGDGVVWWNDNEAVNTRKLQLSIDAADGVLNRIDRIIVEWKTTNYVDLPEIKVLKGSASSAAKAPVLTNNSTVRQISLARISVNAGVTAITASMITDERLDGSVCGIVTESVSVDTSVINAKVQSTLEDVNSKSKSVLKAITDELANLEAGTAVELKKLQFSNVSVSKGDFVSDTTYQDFPYRAGVSLSGVIESMVPEVVLSVDDALSGNYAPVSESYNGGVYLYAGSPPDADITIPTIIMWRGN